MPWKLRIFKIISPSLIRALGSLFFLFLDLNICPHGLARHQDAYSTIRSDAGQWTPSLSLRNTSGIIFTACDSLPSPSHCPEPCLRNPQWTLSSRNWFLWLGSRDGCHSTQDQGPTECADHIAMQTVLIIHYYSWSPLAVEDEMSVPASIPRHPGSATHSKRLSRRSRESLVQAKLLAVQRLNGKHSNIV